VTHLLVRNARGPATQNICALKPNRRAEVAERIRLGEEYPRLVNLDSIECVGCRGTEAYRLLWSRGPHGVVKT
jgi:hypothetical protein